MTSRDATTHWEGGLRDGTGHVEQQVPVGLLDPGGPARGGGAAMTPRQKRLAFIVGGLTSLGVADD